MENLLSKVFFAVTDHYDVIRFKVVEQLDRGNGVIQLKTQLIGDNNSSAKSQHETYYKKVFLKELEISASVFRTYEDANNEAIARMNEKADDLEQERDQLLHRIMKRQREIGETDRCSALD